MRRFLFWSLCFCLLFPVGLSSCDGSDSAAVIFGGTTGELTWTLTEDGVLTITGEGPMPDYRDGGTSETPPWYPHVNRISSLTIGEGVTRIGDYAFMLCSFVTEVVIPESVTSMGDWAFEGCLALYFGQFFYGKSLLDIAVCLYPVVNPLYKFCIGHWNFFLRKYFRFCFRICQKFFFRLYILLKSIFHLFIEQQVVLIAVEKVAVERY